MSTNTASALSLGQMYSDSVIWGRCSGSLASVQRFTIGAHDSVGAAWGSRRCIRSAEPATTSQEFGQGWRVWGYSTRHVPGKETKFCRLNRALGRFGDEGRRAHVSCQKGSGTFCVREPARRVITRKYRSSHAGVEDEEGLLMPPRGSVGPADRATPGQTSGASTSHVSARSRTRTTTPGCACSHRITGVASRSGSRTKSTGQRDTRRSPRGPSPFVKAAADASFPLPRSAITPADARGRRANSAGRCQ
jgi:hypothetical protein